MYRCPHCFTESEEPHCPNHPDADMELIEEDADSEHS